MCLWVRETRAVAQLKLSRLAICPLLAEIDLAEFVYRELINIRDYLYGSELLTSNSDLPVYLLANPALHHNLVTLNEHLGCSM